MPRKIVGLVLAVLMVASLLGERSLVANVASGAQQHVVKPGDTLGAIAAQYGVTVDQLIAENGLADPDVLTEGQTLRIPGASTTAASANPPANQAASAVQRPSSEYVVQPGDTLSGIAKSLGVSLKALLEANPVADPDRLSIGQKLSVPAGAQAPAPATTQGQAGNASTAQSSGQGNGQSQAGAATDAGALLDKLAQQYGVDKALVRALAWADTNGKPRTLEPPGGIGYLKVTGPTFEYIQQALVKRQLDRNSAGDNVEAGIAYLAAMLKWGADENKGLAGFIQGPGSVTANGVRPATDDQVKRVLALRDRIKQGTTQTSTSGPNPGQSPTSSQGTSSSQGTATSQPAPAPAGLGAGGSTSGPTMARTIPADLTAGLAARAIGAARSVAGPGARIGIAGHNLVTGQRLAIAADQNFPAASVDKLALLAEAYRQMQGGKALTDDQQADLRAMIVMSDNDAANRLLELFGPRAVNANLQALGLAGTHLLNPFGSNPPGGITSNVTTPADMVRLLDLLAGEQLVSAQASREMRALLLQAQDASKLRRGLPTDARLAHKSGWYDGVANDVGIVTQGNSSYVIAVFTDGIADAETGNQTIAAVAKVVHEAWGPNR